MFFCNLYRFFFITYKTGQRTGKCWNVDYYDNHTGSFQILPLRTVLFEKWDDEAYFFNVGKELKIFDSSSEYHMIALDITSETPMVYRGEDHGLQFREVSPMSFKDYLHLCVGLYGMRDRMDYFKKPSKEIEEAIAGKAIVDINNDNHILPMLDEVKSLVDKAIAEEKFDLAKKTIFKSDMMFIKPSIRGRYLLDISRLQKDEEAFIYKLSDQIKNNNFDFEKYEEEHSTDPVFQSKAYLKIKKEFKN